MQILAAASRVVVAKGKKVAEFHPKKDPASKTDALAAILGPTGNLRAPTIVRGKTLLVGFNEEAYRDVLG